MNKQTLVNSLTTVTGKVITAPRLEEINSLGDKQYWVTVRKIDEVTNTIEYERQYFWVLDEGNAKEEKAYFVKSK